MMDFVATLLYIKRMGFCFPTPTTGDVVRKCPYKLIAYVYYIEFIGLIWGLSPWYRLYIA